MFSVLLCLFLCPPTYSIFAVSLLLGFFAADCLFVCRLNGLRCVKSETLEPVKHLTQLDLRDNQLTSLDLSAFCSLETLQCQRNQLGSLTLSGFTLRTLHANNNRECKWKCSTPKDLHTFSLYYYYHNHYYIS